MAAAVTNPPKGYHSITPYMTVRDCVAAIAFYGKAFGAEKTMQLDMPDGTIAHAEIRIGGSVERAQYHPGYYGAFVLDPDGNNIEAVHHGAAQRSAASVVVHFDE